MSKLTRKKFEAAVLPLAVAAAFSCALPAHAEVTGSTDTQFTTTVHVVSDNTCQIDVTPPAVTAFDATWTGNTASATSNIVVNNPAIDPITVVAIGGTNCSLNDTKISAIVTGTPNPAATNATNAHSVLQRFGSSGGAWAYMPVVSRIRLFTDDAHASQSTATVTATGADGVAKQQGAAPNDNVKRGVSGNFTSTLGGYAVVLDDIWFSGGLDGATLLTNAGTAGTVSYTTSSPQEVYKSAMFNISGLIGINPVNADTGVEDLNVAANGDTLVIPLTVTITEA